MRRRPLSAQVFAPFSAATRRFASLSLPLLPVFRRDFHAPLHRLLAVICGPLLLVFVCVFSLAASCPAVRCTSCSAFRSSARRFMLSAGLSAVCCPLRFLRPTLRPSLASCAVRGRSPYTACSGCAAVCSASATHSRWPLVVAALRAIAQQGTPSGPGGARGDAPAQPRRHLAAIGAWIMQQAARPGSRCCRRAATSASQVTCGRVNMYTQVTRVDASVRPAGRGVCVLRCSFPPILFGPAVPRATRSLRSACPPAQRVALLPPRGRQGAVQSATRATR